VINSRGQGRGGGSGRIPGVAVGTAWAGYNALHPISWFLWYYEEKQGCCIHLDKGYFKAMYIYSTCLALYCFDYLENMGFVYTAMSMIVIGLSLLY
jgi:hypothetical protein